MANDIGGVWRTVGGRRIFIKDGQSLSDAMKESGKFEKDTKANDWTDENQKRFVELLDKMSERTEEEEKEFKQLKEKKTKYLEHLKEQKEEVEKNKLNKLNDNINKIIEEDNDKYNINAKIFKLKNMSDEEKHNYINEQLTEMEKSYNFENDFTNSLEELYNSELNELSFYKMQALISFDKILQSENRIVNESPYSFSVYGIKKGEKIDWGSKPVGSYRLSDHWNFESRGKIHCKLKGQKKYKQELILARYNGKEYEIVKEFK